MDQIKQKKMRQLKYKKNLMLSSSKYLLMPMLIIILWTLILSSCSSNLHMASTNEGEVLEVWKGHYAKIYLKSDCGTADMYTFLSVYFPYSVNKKDEVILMTKRHLDSLLNKKNNIIKTSKSID